MAHVLKVSTQDGSVGLLGFESQQDVYSFTYDETWQAREGAFPLSPHVPPVEIGEGGISPES